MLKYMKYIVNLVYKNLSCQAHHPALETPLQTQSTLTLYSVFFYNLHQQNSIFTYLMYPNINSWHIIVFRKAGESIGKCKIWICQSFYTTYK